MNGFHSRPSRRRPPATQPDNIQLALNITRLKLAGRVTCSCDGIEMRLAWRRDQRGDVGRVAFETESRKRAQRKVRLIYAANCRGSNGGTKNDRLSMAPERGDSLSVQNAAYR
jgi:hypothetical protein